ncbi:MFS transporter [Amycolatopsis suaedae]|uniref:MFS transporter n=1 Tax=Amycolatopsis suaedae TaxID=2510978 RepID=A0A4Q7J9X7_9PSEU|nr:MFS transporter [Amycolatopsis suaedae]RZQ63756.1 MFS transporter [Amycolatopsis suaedae]
MAERAVKAVGPRLPIRTQIGFAMGSFVTGPFGTVPGLVLLQYLTDTMAIPAAIAGVIVVVPKAWDVLFNPVAGRLSDGHFARTGSRLPYMLLGGIGVAVTFAALFAHPDFGGRTWLDAGYVVLVFFLCATAFAFFQVPYNALPAELTDDYAQRTRLTSWRIAFLALAILASGGGVPLITDAVEGVAGYRIMGVVVGVIIVSAAIAVFFILRRAPVSALRQPTPRWRELLAVLKSWRPFRWLLGIYFVQSLGVSTLLAGVPYMARDGLDASGLRTPLFAGFVGPALVVMPLCVVLSDRLGKVAGLRIFTVVFGIAMLGLLGSPVLPLAVVFFFVALAGIGYAGMQVFPLAILPDLIAAEEERTGNTTAGVAAGVWTAADTLGLALGPGLFGVIIQIGGYVPSLDGSAIQPDSAVTAIFVGFALVPAILVLTALPLARRKLLDLRA